MNSELLGDRVILRRWIPEDRPVFREMNADADVMRYFLRTRTAAESDSFADAIENEFSEKGWGLWAVELRPGAIEGVPSGEFLGFIGFHEAAFESDFTPCPEIGWRLAKRAWGHGLATEGAHLCLEAARGEPGFEKVISFAPLANNPSISVMKKIGLVKDREFDHPSLPDGHPLRMHALYRTDW